MSIYFNPHRIRIHRANFNIRILIRKLKIFNDTSRALLAMKYEVWVIERFKKENVSD